MTGKAVPAAAHRYRKPVLTREADGAMTSATPRIWR
jgi:hypothetical protein